MLNDPNNWRDLCAAAAVEEDSSKLAGLVDLIIKTLDRNRLESEHADSASRPQSADQR